jgi:hypothetical protein
MRTVSPKVMARAVWASIVLVISILLSVLAPGQAGAGFCSSTRCSLALTNSDFIGTGTFGTVNLALSSNVVAVDVNLASAYRIVKTGFPGVIGFADSLGGGLVIGDFKTGNAPTSHDPGSKSSPPGCTTPGCRWGDYGYANNAAATSGLANLLAFQQLSFTVSSTQTAITDVRQLVQQFGESQKEPAYFVVNACLWDGMGRGCRGTGLFAVTQIPEPTSLAIIASGLLALGLLRWKRVI